MNNLVRQSEAQGFEFEIHEAITERPYPFIGVRESHQAIVLQALTKKESEVLIMEDDVCFTKPVAFDYFMDNKPDDFDIYLSSVYHGMIKEDDTIEDFCGLHCYIIHERFYETFLSIGGTGHIDRALAGKGKFVVCNPFVAYQMDGFSDNKQMMGFYEHLMTGRKFY